MNGEDLTLLHNTHRRVKLKGGFAPIRALQGRESRAAGEQSPRGVPPEAKSTVETKMSLGARCDWSSASDFDAFWVSGNASPLLTPSPEDSWLGFQTYQNF